MFAVWETIFRQVHFLAHAQTVWADLLSVAMTSRRVVVADSQLKQRLIAAVSSNDVSAVNECIQAGVDPNTICDDPEKACSLPRAICTLQLPK